MEGDSLGKTWFEQVLVQCMPIHMCSSVAKPCLQGEHFGE